MGALPSESLVKGGLQGWWVTTPSAFLSVGICTIVNLFILNLYLATNKGNESKNRKDRASVMIEAIFSLFLLRVRQFSGKSKEN